MNVDDTPMRPEKVNGSTSAYRTHHRSTSVTTQSSVRSRSISNTDKPLPPPPPSESLARENTVPGSVLDYGDHSTRPSMDGRFSSNSIRPSTKDLYDAYGYKRKEKMGPRPSNDSAGAPNNLIARNDDFRPVSTLPAGLRMPSRKAVPSRPASRQAQPSLPVQTSSSARPNPPSLANSSEKVTSRKVSTVPVAPIHVHDRNNPKPIGALRTPRTADPGSPTMTPEKQRLMKALHIRQKQMAAQKSVNSLELGNMSEEPEFSRTEIDESILGAVIDASASTEGHKAVPIATGETAKERSRLLEDSPISMPETVEAPSTQASSFTDEEETEAVKRQEKQPTLILSLPKYQDLPSDQEVVSENLGSEMHAEAAPIEGSKALGQSASTLSELLIAGESVGEPGAEVKEPLEPASYDDASTTDEQVPHRGETETAEEVSEDKQLLPIHMVEAVEGQTLKEHYGNGAPLLARTITPTAESEENSEVHHSKSVDDRETAASAVEIFQKEDPLQTQSLGDDKSTQQNVNIDAQERVTSQSQECYRPSLENPVRESERSALREAPNDVVKPLPLRRSSSSSSIPVPSDDVNAPEVPLPPIDEDEEISLGLRATLSQEQATTQQPSHTNKETEVATLQTGSPTQSSDRLLMEHNTSNSVAEKPRERPSRRQGIVNPIKRVSSPDQSDEHFLLDESFMEELKSATVQEAKPVSVSKSPIKPVFSRSESEQTLNGCARNSRSVSTPVDQLARDGEILSPPRPATPLSTPRSFSAQQAPRPDLQPSHVPISKKIGVSSSISQRIKALEQLSNRPTSPIAPNLPPNTSAFLSLRSTSLRTPSAGSEYRNKNFNPSRPQTAYPSPSPSPEIIKSSLPNQPDKDDYSRPIASATATILRAAREKSPNISSRPSEPRLLEHQERPPPLELQKSSPPAEQQTMGPPPLSPLKPPRPRFGRYSSTRSESSSSNEQKLELPPTTRRDSFASIRSKSSRAGSEVEFPRTLSDSSQSGVASLDGTQDEKKDSRRSRLLKRMSSISSMSRRSIANALSPSPKEAPIIERQEPTQEALSSSVDVGDVNVQFPDNLVSSTSRSFFTLGLTLTDIYFSFGRGAIWSLTSTAS